MPAIIGEIHGWWFYVRENWHGPMKSRQQAIDTARALSPDNAKTFMLVYVNANTVEILPVVEPKPLEQDPLPDEDEEWYGADL